MRFNQSKLRSVSRRNHCQVCGGDHNCSISEDGGLIICGRVADGARNTARDGRFIHVIRAAANQPIHVHSRPLTWTIASIEQRHAVYEQFLENGALAGYHADDLMRRGLSDTEIARNLYSSYPTSTTIPCRYTAKIAAQFDLTGIPGFFRYGDHWRFVAGGPGFFIPVRDVQGRIQACQVRLDRGSLRYIWFSSGNSDDRGGTSSGAPIHFARPWRALSSGECVITEGALKADIIAEHLDACVVAVAGVTCFNDNFGLWLRDRLPALRIALIAFDSDWHVKPPVEAAMLRMMAAIENAGLEGGLLDWSGAKGLDDLLSEEAGKCTVR